MTTVRRVGGFSVKTAIAVVVANMVGTGVFTSLGYQLADIQSTSIILLLWVTGGIAALCGALSYAELSARLPRSGGEYNFLGQIYHPSFGFVSGWISLLVGFAAPTALAAMTFAAYLAAALVDYIVINRTMAAIGLVVLLTLFHSRSLRSSGSVQNIFTLLKVILIILFCIAVSLVTTDPQPVEVIPTSTDMALTLTSAFAVSLIYVNYAYTGWNAATYITNEIDEPQQNLPKVLITGTLLVMVLYIALNSVFLYAAPIELLQNKIEIGVIVAETAFGPTGGLVMGFILSLMLVSTVSAMIMAGPRVLQMIGEDFTAFRALGVVNSKGVPARAIMLQSALTIVFISTSTFESVLVFSGFVLGFNSLMTVVGLFLLRRQQGKDAGTSYRTWGYPVTPLIYISITLWTLIFITIDRPAIAAVGLAVIGTGFGCYLLVGKR